VRNNQSRAKVTEEFEKLCKLKVSAEYEEKYSTLLAKHCDIFNIEKSNLGYCDTMLHKCFLKTGEPVYVKRFGNQEACQS
jgi:hypothetical protein